MRLQELKAPEKDMIKWVKMEEIRPVGIGREELQLPRSAAEGCELLDTVAYD